MIVVSAIVGSGVGALSRYGLAGVVQRRTGSGRPIGTAVVNLVGAVALGLVTGLQAGGTLSTDAVTILGTGFLGGFTTFSTWMVESVELGREGGAAGRLAVAVNLGVLLVVGVAAAAAGRALA